MKINETETAKNKNHPIENCNIAEKWSTFTNRLKANQTESIESIDIAQVSEGGKVVALRSHDFEIRGQLWSSAFTRL